MKLLKNLVQVDLKEGDDLDALPPDVMTEIQKNIRDGAKDVEQKWANALELVHKAYEVGGYERPTPDLRNAWKQYEENLTYAVQQLAKYRGMDGDWRMSSAVFTEAAIMPRPKTFRVYYSGPDAGQGCTIEAQSLDQVVNEITQIDHGYEAQVRSNENEAHITFSKWGIKKGGVVTIRRV
jgi:hypothetical protein